MDQVDAGSRAGPLALHELLIGGMTDDDRAGQVDHALRQVPGTVTVLLDRATGRAVVTAPAGAASRAALLAAVRGAGCSATAETDRSAQFRWQLARAVLAALLTAPLLPGMAVLIVSHVAGAFGQPAAGVMLPGWAQLALATLVQFGLGGGLYLSAFQGLRHRTATTDLLFVLGASAAWGLGLLGLLAPRPGQPASTSFAVGALIVTIALLGRWLDRRAGRRDGPASRALSRLRPATARVLREGGPQDVAVGLLRSGDLVLVRPGERIPANGVVVAGDGHIEESLLTGLSRPTEATPGRHALGGAINLDGALTVRIEAVGRATMLERIVRLVEAAQAAKPPFQRQLDEVGEWFAPAVLAVALASFVGWSAMGAPFAQAAWHAVAVLVIACPCALALAIPATVLVGRQMAARHGILVHDAAALEQIHAVRAMAFDKTGTLTAGRPTVADVHPAEGVSDADLLRLAAALEAGSDHPLADALRRRVGELALPVVTDFIDLPGRGVRGAVDGVSLLLGSRLFLQEHGVATTPLERLAGAQEAAGRTVCWLAAPDAAPVARAGGLPRLVGLLAFEDRLRPGARDAVRALLANGVVPVMVTGDSPGVAAVVAGALRITQVMAGVLPGDKGAAMETLRGRHGSVAMVGDAARDAPALAAADIAIFVGSGGTSQRAGITLLRRDLGLLPATLEISHRSWSKVRQALAWSGAFNLVGIPLAALGVLGPSLAATALVLSCLAVTANVLLLRRWHPSHLPAPEPVEPEPASIVPSAPRGGIVLLLGEAGRG